MTIRKGGNKGGKRRVSFKPSATGNANVIRRSNFEHAMRAQLEEDDERMIDFEPNKATTFRRRNSPIPRNKAKGLVEQGAGWFQVTVRMEFKIIFLLHHCLFIFKYIILNCVKNSIHSIPFVHSNIFRFLMAINTTKTSF